MARTGDYAQLAQSAHSAHSAQSAISDMIASSRVVITCGSGGVGKTTTAAALGLAAATHTNAKVLVITIDPAKRLATAFGLSEITDKECRVNNEHLRGELSVAMLDTSASWDALIHRHAPDRETEEKILANPLYRNITQRFVQSHDYIAMERVFDLDAQGNYDLIIIDTPPSRHALDFLDAPQRMAEFFSSSLLKWITLPYRTFGEKAGRLGYLAAKPFYQVADRILGSQFLQDIAEFFLLFQGMYDGFVKRADAVTALLHRSTTNFVVVATPEASPLHEAEFFIRELTSRNLQLGALVLNQMLPELFLDANAREEAARIARLSRSQPVDQLAIDVSRSYERFAQLAERQRAAVQRLSETPRTTVRVPFLSLEDHDEALPIIMGYLWSQPPAEPTVRSRSKRAK